jgi:hypothetical protein
MVPVSRLANLHGKLSKDERRIRLAMIVALEADGILLADELAREAEERRLAREKRLAEEEAQRLAAEEEARRRAEEEARRLAEEEAKRLAEEEAKRLAEEEARRLAEEEAKRLAAEEEARRLAEEEARKAAEIAAALKLEDDKLAFLYADTAPTSIDENSIVIPYTKEQYLSFPRKRKKSILTNVRAMTEYRDVRNSLNELLKENSANASVAERIRRLEENLAECEKALPKTPLWDECVQRLKK